MAWPSVAQTNTHRSTTNANASVPTAEPKWQNPENAKLGPTAAAGKGQVRNVKIVVCKIWSQKTGGIGLWQLKNWHLCGANCEQQNDNHLLQILGNTDAVVRRHYFSY